MLKFNKDQVIALCAKLKPTDKILLVGDHGVYLMCMTEVRTGNPTVVYAEGCNPTIDSDFYDNKDDQFGGDDGADEIGFSYNIAKLAKMCKTHVKVQLTEKYIKTMVD